MPRYSGTIYEVLSAPVSYVEIVIGYVGAAATKSLVLGVIILVTARLFVDYEIQHPLKIGRASCREKSVSVRVDIGGRRIIKTKIKTKRDNSYRNHKRFNIEYIIMIIINAINKKIH